MKKGALLNADISSAISRLGHTDTLVVCDAGLPIPSGPQRIDIALTQGIPAFMQVLNVVTQEMQVEAAILASEIKQHNSDLHEKGISTVLITLGRRGVWLSERGQGLRIPGFTVDAVDTIAAGDTFNGVLVTALLEGKEMPDAIRFAHAAAAIAVTREGAQPSVPWREEIEAFLKRQE